MRIDYGAESQTGRRSHNEDSFLTLPERGLFAVSDGMGGLSAGDEASQAAVAWLRSASEGIDTLRQRVEKNPDPDAKLALLDALEGVFQKAARAIHDAAQDRGAQMGATLTVGVIAGEALFVCHVGDSRLYLVRDGRAAPITKDHSVAALQLRRGKITHDEYLRSNMKHVLYQALGVVPQVRPDLLEIGLEDGDTPMVMCSDGVWDMLSRQDFVTLADDADLSAVARHLVEAAYARGSDDNITAVAVRYHAGAAAEGAIDWDAVLRGVPLFSHLDAASRHRLAPFFSVQRLDPDETLFREGQLGEELYIVISGEVAISRGGVELVRFGAGKHFGEIALTLDQPRSATVTATRRTRLGVLHRNQVDALITRSPEPGAHLMRQMLVDLARRVVDLTERVARMEPGG